MCRDMFVRVSDSACDNCDKNRGAENLVLFVYNAKW